MGMLQPNQYRYLLTLMNPPGAGDLAVKSTCQSFPGDIPQARTASLKGDTGELVNAFLFAHRYA